MTNTGASTDDDAITRAGSGTRLDRDRADLLEALGQARYFLRFTVRGLTDEQAAQRTTVSSLCLGGLVKHVSRTERGWMNFVRGGDSTVATGSVEGHAQSFQMLPGERLADVLDTYEAIARDTDELITMVPDLDATRPLPEAPWFPPGAVWSVRRVILHVIAETAQHAGHADIIRESLDGARSMG
jgi:hypothetical protein